MNESLELLTAVGLDICNIMLDDGRRDNCSEYFTRTRLGHLRNKILFFETLED